MTGGSEMRVRKIAATVLGLCLLAASLTGCRRGQQRSGAAHTEDPLIWYNRSGLYAYFPGEEIREIASFDSERETNVIQRILGRHDPSADVAFSADRERVYFLRNYAEDNVYSFFSGELCAKNWEGETETVAEHIVKYVPLAGAAVLGEDKTGVLSLSYRGEKGGLWQSEVIAALVLDFRVSKDGRRAVYLTGDGELFALRFGEAGERVGEPQRIGAGIRQLSFASDDLEQLYGSDGSGSIYYSAGLTPLRVVSVDVTETAFISKTGHLYYLRDEHSVPENLGRAETDTRGAKKEELSQQESEASEEAEEESGVQPQTAVNGLSPAQGKVLCYFDGNESRTLLKNVSRLSSVYSDRTQGDRALVWQGGGNSYSIYLLRDDRALNTGLHLTDRGLLDLAFDASEDKFYYVLFQPDASGEQKANLGTVFEKRYNEEGMEREEALFGDVSGISNAQGGVVFAGAEHPNESYASLAVNGETLAERVASYQLVRENGSALYYLKDALSIGEDKQGTLVRWDGTAGETGEELFYGVSDYEVESDGSVTLLSGYGDAKELWYYSVSGGRRLLDSAALGFRHSESGRTESK